MRAILSPDATVLTVMPYSEVCMHLNIAGRLVGIRFADEGRMVQVVNAATGSPISFPITPGEAGVHIEADGTATYQPYETDDDEPYQGDPDQMRDEAQDRMYTENHQY
jgi:hypothetical protein